MNPQLRANAITLEVVNRVTAERNALRAELVVVKAQRDTLLSAIRDWLLPTDAEDPTDANAAIEQAFDEVRNACGWPPDVAEAVRP